jgi:primosomal protein N' (replication factor Y)
VRNQYIWEILLKLPKDGKLIEQCKREISQQTVIIQTDKCYRSVTILPDVDPV